MITRTCLCTITTALAGLATAALGQQEQWLQYRTSRDSYQMSGALGTANPELVSKSPAGVDLPDFTCEAPYFAFWITPMVPSGGLWLAFDRKGSYGPHDLLYIDSNGNGSLADEPALKAYAIDARNAKFEPAKIVFQGEDGPITYHLNVKFYSYGERRYLNLWAGCWYEGDIEIAGLKKHCMLIDHNANGTFDDKSIDADSCDRIRIGEDTRLDTRFVGKYIEVDDALYNLDVARDGAYVKLTRAENVPSGNINLPEAITVFVAGGENGFFVRRPKGRICSLPVGKYRIDSWIIEREDDKGAPWRARGARFGTEGRFDVTEGNEVTLSIGEPLVCTLSAGRRGSTYSFSQDLKGSLGESIDLDRRGGRPQAPRLHIKNRDGTYDRTFSFEYG